MVLVTTGSEQLRHACRGAWAAAMCVSVVCCVLFGLPASGMADKIGEVSTTFKILGANDKIVIEAFDDPGVDGVTCYLSRAKSGGVSGSLGLAEDTSDASIACRQVGPITLSEDIQSKKRDGESVFKKRTSILFKTMQVVRFYDAKRNVLVYMTYSDKLVDGSPKNSITCVPVMTWRQ